ncbi:hypothetical protein Gpo141_00001961 [Globisporangium polare]
MAQSLPVHVSVVMPHEDPHATLEDVMAFINGFGATTTAMATLGTDDGTELWGSGFSSDTSDEGLLIAQSEELLGMLEVAVPPATATVVMPSVKPEALVQQSDQSCDSSASSSNESTKMRQTVKETTRKRNAYRESTKRELQYLRLRSVEMEQQLAALQQGTIAELTPEDKQLIDSTWKRIAKNQLEARMESEAENARLKSVLQSHMEMTRLLEEQSLGKRFNAAMLTADVRPKVKRGRTASVYEDEGFADLASELDASFERLHQVLEAAGLDSAAMDATRSFQMKTMVSASGVVTPYTELTDTAITPFHPRLTAKAVWRSLRDQYHQKRADYEPVKLWQSGNTFAVKCRYTFKTKTDNNEEPQEVHLNCKIVLRKYVDEESRMVLVWRAQNEGEGDFAGVYADETGWSIMQPIPGSCGYSSNGSVIHTCIHVVHRRRDTSSVLGHGGAAGQQEEQHAAVKVLTDLVVASNEEDMIGITKAVESLLLDEVRTGGDSKDPFP